MTLSDKQCWGGDGLWNMEYTVTWSDGRSEHYGPVYHVRERFVLDLYSGGELWHVSNGDFNCP